MQIIMKNGQSFKDWVDQGYPGAKSFPKECEVLPDVRRGLCTFPNCDNVIAAYGSLTLELCQKHYGIYRASFGLSRA